MSSMLSERFESKLSLLLGRFTTDVCRGMILPCLNALSYKFAARVLFLEFSENFKSLAPTMSGKSNSSSISILCGKYSLVVL